MPDDFTGKKRNLLDLVKQNRESLNVKMMKKQGSHT